MSKTQSAAAQAGTAPRQETVRKMNYAAIALHIVVMAGLTALAFLLIPVPPEAEPIQRFFLALIIGPSVYLLYSRLARGLATRHHRRGIRFMRARQWAQGIEAFRASYAQFQRAPLLDQARALLLLDPSGMSYREMALNNIGYGFVQLDRLDEARQMYEQVLREFPDSHGAVLAQRVLDSIAHSQQ